MKEQILKLLEENRKMTPAALSRAMRIKSSGEIKELGIALNELEDERAIYNDHEQYVLVDGVNWMSGKVRDISSTEYAVINKDNKVYVPKKATRMMMDKDEVLVRLDPNGNEIVHIYERGVTLIAGTMVHTRYGFKFRSDVDLHTSFDVVNKKAYHLESGMKVVVKVVEYASPLKVKIVEILGRENEPGVDVSCILAENEVRQEFNKKVRKETELIPEHVRKKELKDRHDLRDLLTVTIDGDSTKDFDDAISVEKLPDGGWKLYVHIADVSHYVDEGCAIDEEAFKRGTSIYVADRVVPMLPFALSNGICSLNPGVDRLTLTCEMDFSKDGLMTGYDIYESVIHSDKRCTYNNVNTYLEEAACMPDYEPVGEMLRDFSDLAHQMKHQTEQRGHIEFETKEPYFVLDAQGTPIDVHIRERGWSEQMIEEAMIAANVAVAHELHSNSFPGMFRVHEIPDPEKLSSLVGMARILNVPCNLDVHNTEPKDIARFLASIEDERDRQILSTVAVRSMQKARYSEQNLGHYGLALDEYCHFTSPIRRYPDLLIHRMLRRHVIERKNDEKTLLKDIKRMEKSALHLSEREKDAVTVERAVDDLESAKYMANKVGQEFDAIISGVASFGFFAQLDNTIEGMIPLRYMDDDFYKYNPETMTLTGENTQKTFTLGMPIRVRLRDVNVPKRQITFDYLAPAGEQPKQEQASADKAPALDEGALEEKAIPASKEETGSSASEETLLPEVVAQPEELLPQVEPAEENAQPKAETEADKELAAA